MHKTSKRFYLFLLIFAAINLVQAFITPVTSDEAYYLAFAQHPAWGYFDHPPMVAWIIYIGFLIFKGIAGLRIMTVLLSSLTVLCIWKLMPEETLNRKNSDWLFFLLILAFPVFNMYGFITTPDVPLLFFGTLYVLVFRKLLIRPGVNNTIILGIIAAALIYSKYHGGIIILLSVVLNLKILKKPHIYFAGLIALTALIPHLIWQMNHDFITFNYHLFERTKGTFEIKHILEYLVGTIGVLNPFIILFLIYLSVKNSGLFHSSDPFWKRLFTGFILFFFLYSFRSKTEAHWVAFAAIPLLVMTYAIILKNEKYVRQIKVISIISASLIVLARISIALPLPLKTDFHKEKQDYFEAIADLANGRIVVFVNSYQRAAKYAFYTGNKSMSLNNVFYRKNQYDLWNSEEDFNNKNILLIGNWPSAFFDTLTTNNNELILFKQIDKFPLISKINASIQPEKLIMDTRKANQINFELHNPYETIITLNRSDFPVTFFVMFENAEKKYFVPLIINSKPDELLPDQTLNLKAEIDAQTLPKGAYSFCFVFKTGYLYHQQISKRYEAEIH
ncbi:ArnT family glycosyltransferase [Saccharicrinis sp. FJH62]|uniref:ArnT family glycosyltransferase n=1 Tax=Saccharicrinis sp. FJH62 TaxID=3344657 RepID=UPI0035D4D328